MKKLILPLLIAMSIILTGCSAFKSARWDNNEYSAFVHIKTDATMAQKFCNTPDIIRRFLPSLTRDTEYVKNYTEFLIENNNTHQAAVELNSLAIELETRYDKGSVSEVYCNIKFGNIINATDTILQGIIKKVRK